MNELTTRPTELVSAAPAPVIDQAIGAWLHAKAGKSGSKKTAHQRADGSWKGAYPDVISEFRKALHRNGLELDQDPRAVALAAQAWAALRINGEGDVSPATYNQRLSVLSSFYRYAKKIGLHTGENPIERVDRRSVQTYANSRAIDEHALATRLKAIDRTTLAGQRDYALLTIYYITGRRLAEVASLRWGDIHQDKNRVTLTFRHAKGGKVMVDTLPAGISKALMIWLASHYGAELGALAPVAPIWVSRSSNGTAGLPLSVRAISQICADRLGVSKVHALRHTFAHTMEAAGAKVSEIQSRLGHASLATTGKYLASLSANENPYAESLARRLGLDD
jgi:integrase